MRKVFYGIVSVVAAAVAVAAALSLLTDTPNKYLKFLDFPRLQFFWTAVVALPLFVALTRRWRWYDVALVVGLVAGAGIQAYYLLNYTGIVGEDVPTAEASVPDDRRVSLLMANVLEENRDTEPLLEMIAARDPDLFLGMETNDFWDEALADVQARYPHSHEVINNAGYGMVLYSKFPLRDLQVRYLQNDQVPSFETVLALPGGREVELHCVHPVPPTDFQDMPDNEGQAEVAFSKVGEMVQAATLPVIVAGDYNDVFWSRTDRLTGTEDLLYDVRVGRGLLSSFDATNWLMRWPLDHVMVTEEFGVVELELLGDIGSDHFPVYVELALTE